LGDGWTGGVAFMDRQTDDARLTVAIARDAKRRGAAIELGSEVTSVERRGGVFRVVRRDEEGRSATMLSRCVVNAGGPWCDRVRGLAGASRPILRTSRGAHLVLSDLALHTALILPGVSPGHRVFAIPWRDATLFGTTDVADPGDPGVWLPEVEDIRVLFDLAQRLFPRAGLSRRHVLSSFAGLRPLLDQKGDTLASSREHSVVDENGFVTIAGGKLTTWRTMAVATIDAVVRRLGRGGASPRALAEEPLPGGDSEHPDLDAVLTDEMARHADDVVFRRLPIGHDPQRVRRELPAILERMSARFGWDPARRQAESMRVLSRLEADSARLDEALGGALG
jgi:glycerol-3-phosphate dehydrogenase